MNRKPDVIRALVVVFTVGLMISGLTTLAASDSNAAGSGADLSSIMSQQDEGDATFRNN